MNRKVGQASRLPRSRSRPEAFHPARAGALAGQAGRLPYLGSGPVHGPNVRQKGVEALHETSLVWSPAFRRLERLGPAEDGTPSSQRFMVPMRGIKVVDALHEP